MCDWCLVQDEFTTHKITACLSSPPSFSLSNTLRSSTVTLRLLYTLLCSCFFIWGGTTGIFYIFGAFLACCLLAWDYTYFFGV
jgi:hypothetical protein